MDTTIIPKGTTLYHGTDAKFEEQHTALGSPAWVTDNPDVAERFARRSGGWGGVRRVIKYVTVEDIELYEVYSAGDFETMVEEFNLNNSSTTELRESAADANIIGWRAFHNYRPGDDILIRDTDLLDHVDTRIL